MISRDDTITELLTITPTIKRLMFARTHAMLQEYKLSSSEFELFFVLQHCPDPPSSKELRERLHLSPGAVSQLVDSLGKLGYLEQRPDQNDRRIQRLHLTREGKKIGKTIAKNKHLLIRGVMEQLSDDELSSLLGAQKKILEILQKEL